MPDAPGHRFGSSRQCKGFRRVPGDHRRDLLYALAEKWNGVSRRPERGCSAWVPGSQGRLQRWTPSWGACRSACAARSGPSRSAAPN